MAKNFLRKYHLFNPKTIQDILISPYSFGCNLEFKNVSLHHDGRFWIVIKTGEISNGYWEFEKESDAIDMFWRYMCSSEETT